MLLGLFKVRGRFIDFARGDHAHRVFFLGGIDHAYVRGYRYIIVLIVFNGVE